MPKKKSKQTTTRRPRTDPPRVDDRPTPPVEDQATPAADPVVDPPGRFVTVRVPVANLPPLGYQSASNPPRQIRSRRLDRPQGFALAAIRLGMVEQQIAFDASRRDFNTGGARKKLIETKEECVAKLLELVAHAINEQAGD